MKRFFIILFTGFSLFCYAQDNDLSIKERWSKTIDKSETYNEYKVIKRTALSELWKAVEDTMNGLRQDLAEERSVVKSQASQITSMKKEAEEKETLLQNAISERDNMSFLGMPVEKSVYSTMMWIFVFILSGICAFLFFLFKRSHSVTTEKIRDYDQLQKAFEEYKQGKMEMERKLKREMQTYINKIEEMRNRR